MLALPNSSILLAWNPFQRRKGFAMVELLPSSVSAIDVLDSRWERRTCKETVVVPAEWCSQISWEQNSPSMTEACLE